MKWKRITFFVVTGAALILVVLKLKQNKDTATGRMYRYDKEKPVTVKADTIAGQHTIHENIFTGTFEPDKESKISADVQGKINRVLVETGDYVYKGQPLVQLDNSLLQLQLKSVEVQIEGLQADVNRNLVLAKADAIQGVQLEKAELGLKAALLQKEILQEQIRKTTLTAPYNGVVTAKMNEEGGFAAPGIPLLQITDISKLKFTILVPENDLNRFVLNKNYSVTADAYPQPVFNGNVTMTGSKANSGNSFPVQFTVINSPDLKIKSGMFGKVHIRSLSDTRGCWLPVSALYHNGGITSVYRIKDGKAILQRVTVVEYSGSQCRVTQGVKSGDIIVTQGFINLYNGARVVVEK